MEIFESHISDLAERAFMRGYSTYSEFLNLDEISRLHTLRLAVKPELFGGYGEAERCVACFSAGGEKEYPISCICINPLNKKFSDKLSHRDYLGSLMNLGINRNTLGDIIISEDAAYLFCLDSICDYIIQELTRIKHTSVKCEKVSELPEIISEKLEESIITVPSLRADAVCSAVYKLSRSGASELFRGGKVFINSRLCEKERTQLKDGDRVSVRGKGKFIFCGEIRETKRGRLAVSVRIYK